MKCNERDGQKKVVKLCDDVRLDTASHRPSITPTTDIHIAHYTLYT